MTKTIEVFFEDQVFKSLYPVKGIREYETAWVLIRPKPLKSALRRLFGTLDQSEADCMRETIDREFEKTEGHSHS